MRGESRSSLMSRNPFPKLLHPGNKTGDEFH
jgi:hypothetical protein